MRHLGMLWTFGHRRWVNRRKALLAGVLAASASGSLR